MGRQSQQYIPSACNHLAGIVEFCPIDKKLTKLFFGQNRGALHVLSFVILSAAKNLPATALAGGRDPSSQGVLLGMTKDESLPVLDS